MIFGDQTLLSTVRDEAVTIKGAASRKITWLARCSDRSLCASCATVPRARLRTFREIVSERERAKCLKKVFIFVGVIIRRMRKKE